MGNHLKTNEYNRMILGLIFNISGAILHNGAALARVVVRPPTFPLTQTRLLIRKLTMKTLSTLTTVAVLAATLGTAAAAHTTTITRAGHHGYTVVTTQPTHLPRPVLHPSPSHLHRVGAPLHLHPAPLPYPGPVCLSCPSTPYYTAPYQMMPSYFMR
jgi:hypothetical protein